MSDPQRPSRALLACFAFVALASAGCNGAGAGAIEPAEGNWVGDHVIFVVSGGGVDSLWTRDVACEGRDAADGPCLASHNAILGSDIPIVEGSFGGTFGPVTLTGTFASASTATGTLSFAAPDGCCTVDLTWTASYREPDFPDAGPSDSIADGGTEPSDTVDATGPAYPHAEALGLVNDLRRQIGVPALEGDEALRKAAQAHADYYVRNCDAIRAAADSPHHESPSLPGFTGETFVDRLAAQGYGAAAGWEVMTFQADPARALELWLASLYHRVPLLHPNAAEAGYGAAEGEGEGCVGGARADVMDFGSVSSTVVRAPVAFPYDGQTGVPVSWNGAETPQPPLPEGESYPSGPIVTLMFPRGQALTLDHHALLDPNGGDIPHEVQTPDDSQFLTSTLGLYAHDPLQPATTYTVEMSGTWGGATFDEIWSFTTAE